MYRQFHILLLLGMTLLLMGCTSDEQMPEELPDDFAFSVHFGVNSKNVIDSINGVAVKDLIGAGTAEATITFSKEELKRIYEQMKNINVLEAKQLIGNTNCLVEPHGEDQWRIRIDGQEKTIHWSGEYCQATEDVEQLIDLRNYVLEIVKSKEAYKALPEPEGAYE